MLVNKKMPGDTKYGGNLEGRSILVTGGGTGIGAGCTEILVMDGALVTICGRRKEVLEATAESIERSTGVIGAVHIATGDVTNEEDVARIVEKSLEPTGRLDGCVANAGGGGLLNGYESMDTDEFKRVLNLNVISTMLCIKHTLPHLINSGNGSFVGVSSVAGVLTHRWMGAYPVGKAAVDTMIQNAADEYGEHGVRFNAIRPGFVATETMEIIPRDSEIFASYIENTPMTGVASSTDVGELARFLMSSESRWITGQCIGIDGGQCLRRGPDYTSFKA